jgi:hypothetical protein
VRKSGETEFSIAPRPLRIQDAIWIRPTGHDDVLEDEDRFRRIWLPVGEPAYRVQDGELATLDAGGRRDADFVLVEKLRTPSSDTPVGEARLAMDVEFLAPGGEFFLRIRNEHGAFTLRLRPGGVSELLFQGRDGEVRQTLTDVRVDPDRSLPVELMVYDGRAIARVGGVESKELVYITTKEKLNEGSTDDHQIAFGAREATFKARKLLVGRDLYYKGESYVPEDRPTAIGPKQYLMMGDNVDHSHDSRKWQKLTYRLKDGTTVVCESQEINGDEERAVMQKLGLDRAPDIAIGGDRFGRPWAISRDDLAEPGPDREGAPFVDQKYIVGKALWVWWPKGRWFRLIR